MTSWIKLKGKKGKGDAKITTSRFDWTTWQALERVAARDGIKVSVLIYTAVLRLPEVKQEIANIKREKRGEQSTPDGRLGHR